MTRDDERCGDVSAELGAGRGADAALAEARGAEGAGTWKMTTDKIWKANKERA